MKNMKKTLLVSLSLVLVAALAVGLTLAYLQDDDSDVNVMTLGNVKIEQHEYERVVNADGTYATKTIDGVTSYVLQDFTQGKALLPIVGDPNEPGNSAAYAGYDDTIVRMTQVDSYGGMQVFAGKNAQDKFVVVENTGKTDAYVRTLVAIEVGSTDGKLIKTSYHKTWGVTTVGNITVDGNTYLVFEYIYKGGQLSDGSWRHENGILPAGDTSYPNLSQVYLKHNATNEDMIAIDGNGNGTLDILVLSQAVQAAGFENAQTALDTAFGKSSEKAAEWFGGEAFDIPTTVSTAAELTAALKNGGEVVLTDDIELDGDEKITVTGNTVLNLNGNTIESVAEGTGNRELFLVKGDMTVKNGTVELEATVNQGWNAMAAIFDVTAGGVLNMDGVTLNVSGTDMTFGVHLNNWGEVTLNMNNCTVNTNYCAVRVFNSGYDMNNVTITNSTLKGKTRAFWVHNYIGDLDSAKHSDEAIKARLNLDIYNNNNSFVITDTAVSPIRYGFGTTVYFDTNGNQITNP